MSGVGVVSSAEGERDAAAADESGVSGENSESAPENDAGCRGSVVRMCVKNQATSGSGRTLGFLPC